MTNGQRKLQEDIRKLLVEAVRIRELLETVPERLIAAAEAIEARPAPKAGGKNG